MEVGILVLLGVTALGAWMIYRGRRGVRIDEHPICSHCGFDLIGRPEGVNRCSECGADLLAPSAIRVGHRQRRVGLMLSGAGLVLFSVGLMMAIILASTQTIDWRSKMPVWWLMRELSSADAATVDAASKE